MSNVPSMTPMTRTTISTTVQPSTMSSDSPSIPNFPSLLPSPSSISSSPSLSSPILSTSSPSTVSRPSTAKPTKGSRPIPSNSQPTTIDTLKDTWFIFLILVVALFLCFGLQEIYKRRERNDPDSDYSRRQRRREREESLRQARRAILENAERRRRDWNYLWDEEGGMMRRELKREYILNNLGTKIYGAEQERNEGNDNSRDNKSSVQSSISNKNISGDDSENNDDEQIQNGPIMEEEYEEKQDEGQQQQQQELQRSNNSRRGKRKQKVLQLSNNSRSVNQQDLQSSTNSRRGRLQGIVKNVLSLTSSSRRSRNTKQSQQNQYEESNFSKITCGICLENYENGEEICFSVPLSRKMNTDANTSTSITTSTNDINDRCDHVFHTDCMLQWLMKNRSEGRCPLCRKTFLSMEEYEQFYQFQQSGGNGPSTSNGNRMNSSEDNEIAVDTDVIE